MSDWPQVPFDTERDYSMCFGCGPDNPIGLKLKFEWDGEITRAEFVPDKHYQGWSGFVHGGIISCMLDEALCYAAFFSNAISITAKMDIRLHRMASVGEPLVITSSVIRKNRRLIETSAVVSLKDGTRIAEGTSTQFVVKNREE